MAPIMQKARERDVFKRPDVSTFIPEGMEDVVARVSAAGQKLMYSEDMRDDLLAAVQSNAPTPHKLAENVAGLMLVLDQQTPGGGIPQEALFPAGLDLLAEAAEVLTKAGQTVAQEDFNEAARMLFVLMAKKLGVPDEEIMGAAAQAAGVERPVQPEPPPEDEEAAMQEGFR